MQSSFGRVAAVLFTFYTFSNSERTTMRLHCKAFPRIALKLLWVLRQPEYAICKRKDDWNYSAEKWKNNENSAVWMLMFRNNGIKNTVRLNGNKIIMIFMFHGILDINLYTTLSLWNCAKLCYRSPQTSEWYREITE